MQKFLRWCSLVVPVAVLGTIALLGLTACHEKGPAEKIGESVDRQAERTGETLEDAADDVEDAVDDLNDR